MQKLKVAIIGAGSRGVRSFGKYFGRRDDCELVGLVDPNVERMRSGRRTLENDALGLYENVEQLFRAETPDVAVVTSPDYLHREHTVAALQAGCHVLVDKPLATRTVDCKEIARVSLETGKTVDVGFNMRHGVVCRKIKDLIREGAIGKLVTIENHDYYGGGRTYMSRWNRFYEKSGGLFCHKGSHDFDAINWYNEGALPAKVAAFAGVNVLTPDGLPFDLEPGEEAGPYCEVCAVAHKCKDRFDVTDYPNEMFVGKAREADGYHKDTCMYLSEKDTHDNGIAIVEYDNGVRASHWECFFTPLNTRRFTVIGDRGHLDADFQADSITIFPRWSKDRVDYHLTRPEGGHGGTDPVMVETFVRNVQQGRRPVATVRDGTLSVAVAEAAEKSRREGRIMEISELISRREIDELP